jgi:hypothetical protein
LGVLSQVQRVLFTLAHRSKYGVQGVFVLGLTRRCRRVRPSTLLRHLIDKYPKEYEEKIDQERERVRVEYAKMRKITESLSEPKERICVLGEYVTKWDGTVDAVCSDYDEDRRCWW